MRKFMASSWGLERNLFVSSPPEPAVLSRVFTGRDKEMEQAMVALLDAPRRLLLNGLFGVGKTIMIQELSRRIHATIENVLRVHEQLYSSDPSLAYVILRGLCTELEDEDDYARQINEVYLGQIVSTKRQYHGKLEMKSDLPKFFESAGTEEEGYEVQQSVAEIPLDAVPVIRRILAKAKKRDATRRVVITIDDLDKRDPESVRELLTGCRDLLHKPPCSFVFTGHPLGIMRDSYSSAGGIIDEEIPVQVMNSATMRVMVAWYLGAGRVKNWKFWRYPVFDEDSVDERALVPFTIGAIDEIVRRSYGIPRVLNIICFNILQQAAGEKMPKIDVDELAVCWNACGERLRRGIRPDLRSLLDLLAERREPLSLDAIPDRMYEHLQADTKEELVQQFDYALKNDLLVTNN